MTARPAAVSGTARVTVLPAVLVAVLVACGRWEAQQGWDGTAARAVARSAAALQPDEPLVVLQHIGDERGDELPWAVRQSLTTGGIQLTPAIGDTAARTLVFEQARRDGEDWIMHTRMLERGGRADSRSWRVRCTADTCDAVPAP